MMVVTQDGDDELAGWCWVGIAGKTQFVALT